MQALRTLRALFSLPGFVASARLKGVFGDRCARVVVLRRRKKRRGARAAAIGAVDAKNAPTAPWKTHKARFVRPAKGWRVQREAVPPGQQPDAL